MKKKDFDYLAELAKIEELVKKAVCEHYGADHLGKLMLAEPPNKFADELVHLLLTKAFVYWSRLELERGKKGGQRE